MSTLRVLALLWATSAFATTTPPANQDLYSDSLTLQRSSAEAPGSLDASAGDASGAGLAEASDSNDEQPLESVSEVVKATKTKPKKSAHK